MEGEMALGQIGERLAEARTAKGLSLAQVEEITKIRLKYLAALEAEDWQVIPGEVYLRGFLKSYAQAVGIDPAAILELYQPTPPPQSAPIPVATPPVRASAPRVERLTPPRTGKLSGGYGRVDRHSAHHGARRLVSVIVIIILLAGAVYLGYRIWPRPSAATPSPAPSGAVTGEAPVTTPGTGTPSTQPPQSTPTTTAPAVQLTKQSETRYEVRYLVKSAQPLTLKVGIKEVGPGQPVGECWIDVQSDTRNVGDTTLRSGRTQEYTASDTIRLRLGNPQVAGLAISVNGVEVPRLQTNEALDLVFTRQTP